LVAQNTFSYPSFFNYPEGLRFLPPPSISLRQYEFPSPPPRLFGQDSPLDQLQPNPSSRLGLSAPFSPSPPFVFFLVSRSSNPVYVLVTLLEHSWTGPLFFLPLFFHFSIGDLSSCLPLQTLYLIGLSTRWVSRPPHFSVTIFKRFLE